MDINSWKMMAVAGFAALGGMVWTQVMAPGQAQAYPSGAAVSYGSNPVQSFGGNFGIDGGTVTISPGIVGQDFIISDVVLSGLSSDPSCWALAYVTLEDSGGTLAQLGVKVDSIHYGFPSHQEDHSFVSGLKVADGESVTLTSTLLNWDVSCVSYPSSVYYTLSGYYAQP